MNYLSVKEASKKLTREEFLDSEYVRKNCPSTDDLTEFNREQGCTCMFSLDCKECWDKAVKELKFMGDEPGELTENNIHEVAATMTKEEFIKLLRGEPLCPCNYGLTEECERNCDKCCEESVERSDLKFKEEVKETPKEETIKEEFLCIKDFVMTCKEIEFTAGKTYVGKQSICSTSYRMTNNSGNTNHSISEDVMDEYFIKADKAFDTAIVFSILTANQNLKFKRVSDGLILQVKDGVYNWKGGYSPLAPDDQWILTKEIENKPVTFNEAVKAYSKENKIIECHIMETVNTYDPFTATNGMTDQKDRAIGSYEILDGEWFIINK